MTAAPGATDPSLEYMERVAESEDLDLEGGLASRRLRREEEVASRPGEPEVGLSQDPHRWSREGAGAEAPSE